ncbi:MULTISPECIES: ATP-binding protein [unclassified Streptomyces]|uniref:ATP-binding protein n=1 Tax=unclassified Streptomyces TaxID=2593676 RepID=UPI00336A49F5
MLKANTLPDEGVQLPSTPRGARLARRLAVRRMGEWGYPPDSDTSCTVALLVAELASNAVRHGRVAGRSFRLRLALVAAARTIRIEVSDAREDRLPVSPQAPSDDDETGRGLLLVELLATRWGVVPRSPVGKTVWAEVAADRLAGDAASGGGRSAS